MEAKEACVVIVESGQDVCIPVHPNNESVKIEGFVRKGKERVIRKAIEGFVRKGKERVIRKAKVVLGAVFCPEEAAAEDKVYQDRKTLSIVSGIVMGANCGAITSVPSSLENRDEGFRQAVLIPATLSLMTTLFIIAATVVLPTFNFTRVKKLVALAIIFTASSYFAFVAMKLGPICEGTVIAIIFAATYIMSIALVFLSHTFTIKSPQALG